MDTAIIAQWGGFGAIFLIFCGGFGILALEYRRLRIKYDEVQAARVTDAREVIRATREATKDFGELLREKNIRDINASMILGRIAATLDRVEERLEAVEGQLPKRRV